MPRSPQTSRPEDTREDYLAAWGTIVELMQHGSSWSGRERNCAFLNVRGQGSFANFSAASGIDFEDDGRALAVADWDHDGDVDLWLYNRTGPRLRLMRNDMGAQLGDFLGLQLKGTACNRDAIGARVEVHLKDQSSGRLVQSVIAGDGFLSQSSKWLHFGLGSDAQINGVSVTWPGGRTESFTGVEAGRFYTLVEGTGRAVEWHRPSSPSGGLKLAPGTQHTPPPTAPRHIYLGSRLHLPTLRYTDMDRSTEKVIRTGLRNSAGSSRTFGSSKPVLVNLWASWCAPCLAELKELTRQEDELRSLGLEILVLSVDGLGSRDSNGDRDGDDKNTTTTLADARRVLDRIHFPFETGAATAELIDKIETVRRFVFDKVIEFAIPLSMLIDNEGRLVALYHGPIDVEVLKSDLSNLDVPPMRWRDLAAPLPGRWSDTTINLNLQAVAAKFMERYPEDTARYLRLARRQLEDAARAGMTEAEKKGLLDKISQSHLVFAIKLQSGNSAEQAIVHFRKVLEIDPGSESARFRLAVALQSLRRDGDALVHLRQLVTSSPDHAEAHYRLGISLREIGKRVDAIACFRRAIEIKPKFAPAHNVLGVSLATQGDNEDAIQHFQQALRIDRDYAEAHKNLGISMGRKGRHEDAVHHFEEAVRLDPQDEKAQLNLGIALRLVGRFDDAIERYRQMVKLKPKWVVALNELAWLLATHPDATARRPEEGIQLARRAASLTKNRNPTVLNTLAAAQAAAGQYQAASRTAEQALRLANNAREERLAEQIEKRLKQYRREIGE